jgi:hypothetical protein
MRRTTVGRLVGIAAFAAAAACAAEPIKKPLKAGPVDTGPGTLTAARQYLEGTWTLESFEVAVPGKGLVPLTGTGRLTYDEFGNLRMDVEADQASVDILRSAGIQLTGNRIASEGRTVVDMQARTLAFILEGQKPGLGPLALNRLRYWQVDGTLLTLTTRDDAGNPVSVGKWRKAQS